MSASVHHLTGEVAMQPNEERAWKYGFGAKRPEIPPPPKLTPEEIERVEEWLRKNVTPPTHGPFRW